MTQARWLFGVDFDDVVSDRHQRLPDGQPRPIEVQVNPSQAEHLASPHPGERAGQPDEALDPPPVGPQLR